MTRKSLAKPKLTDAARHNRFVAMAQQVGASDDVKDFEKAFQKAFKNAFDKIACQKDAARRRPS
jgi:hypothetical protein